MSEVSLLRAVESDESGLSAVSDVPQPANDVVVPINPLKKIPPIEFHNQPPDFGYPWMANQVPSKLPKQWRWNPKHVYLEHAVGKIDIVVNSLRDSEKAVMNANFTAFLQTHPELVQPQWNGLTLYAPETVFLERTKRAWVVGLLVTSEKGQRVLKRVNSCLQSSFGAGSRIAVLRP